MEITLPTALETEDAFRAVVNATHRIYDEGEIADMQEWHTKLRAAVDKSQLKSTHPQTADAYQEILAYSQLAMLPVVEEDILRDLFMHRVIFGLRSNIDLRTRLDLLFIYRQDDVRGRRIRRLIVDALAQNDEWIGAQGFTIPDGIGLVDPQVRYWIIDFLRHRSSSKTLTALDIATFLSDRNSVHQLKDDERQLLEQLLSLYVYLVTQPIASYALAAAGPMPTPAARPTAAPARDFRTALLQSLYDESQAEEAVFAEEQRLMAEGRYSRVRIHDALWTALGSGTAPTLEAALFLMARAGELHHIVARDQRVQAYMEQSVLPALLPVLKEQRPTMTQEVLTADFRQQPARAVYFMLFLRGVLTTVHAGDEALAARTAVRLLDLLFRAGYTDAAIMAYYDADQQRYRWANLRLDSQGVPVLSE